MTEIHTSGAPICDVDFYDDANVENPVDAYHKMLALGPVVWLPKNNLHAICGFEELTKSLRNHRVFQSGKGVSINEEINPFLIGSTLNSDPPRHDETRAITFSPLTPRALKDVKDRIETEAQNLAETMTNAGEFDAASELAPYLPLTIVCDLVGLGEHGSNKMLEWGAATFELMGDPRERREAALGNLKKLRAFLEDSETLGAIKPDGWANLATQGGIAHGLESDKAVELMRDYIAPSLDTTISAIGYAMMLFAKHPEQWQKLRADRSLIANAIEEVVRMNTPIKAFSRYIGEDIEVGGVQLKAGTRALMVYGAANRDESKFPDPDRFDIERKVRGHVGFGHGVHACLGMHLARLEITCLLNALADRIEQFELSGPVVSSVNSSIHSLASVPVRVI
ncbi:cytochrome P450 [Planktotalea frisia]|uniref:cytochrome P450 n=1 Tax=Planktotalea frisia TaxID=696762 RepID=UPI0023570103|nr:cytochrome P450 [Planktotalea frisia]